MAFLYSINPLMRAIWATLLIAGVVSLGLGRWSLAFVSFATLALALLPPILASRLSLTLPVPFLLFTTGFVFASVFLGEAFDFYEKLWWWDMALHGFSAMGFGLIGFLFAFMLFDGDRLAAPPWGIALISFCFAVTVGAVWEIFEFAMDQTFGLNMQKSGLMDTMGDLIIDTIGAGIASLLGLLYLRDRTGGKRVILGNIVNEFIELNRRLYRKSRRRLRR